MFVLPMSIYCAGARETDRHAEIDRQRETKEKRETKTETEIGRDREVSEWVSQ